MRLSYGWIVFASAIAALVVARPYAGAWNDGSRLATVESIVDRHTWVIDDSIYIDPSKAERPPYDADNALVAKYGTLDKLLINGRYYSDKSPVPAVLMVTPYQVWRRAGGPSATERPDLFARGMTWLFAGLPYVFAVWAIGRMTRSVGVPRPWDLLLTAGFAFGSLALPYAEHVNNHILLLAVACGIAEAAVRPGPMSIGRAAWLGALAGLGYTIDLGAGPPLFVAVAGLVAWQSRGPGFWRNGTAFALAAVPFVAANHAITYAIAGTIGPANAKTEYLDWPGSPFTGPQATGGWHHKSIGLAGLYALDLLYGKKGFLTYSPPLMLAGAGLPLLLLGRRAFVAAGLQACRVDSGRPGGLPPQLRERPALLAMAFWTLATWLLYAATSHNLSGECLSIRWFVPLLAAGYLALAVLVREVPAARTDLIILLAAAFALAPEFVIGGPWYRRIPYTYWPVAGLIALAWGCLWVRRLLAWRRNRRLTHCTEPVGTT